MKDLKLAPWALSLCAAVGLGAWILLAPDLSPPQPGPPSPGDSQPTASTTGRAPAPPTREEVPTGTPEPAKEGRRGVLIGRILDGLGRAVADCQVILGQVSGQSDRAGRFRLEHPGGSSLVMVLQHPDFPTTTAARGLKLSPDQSVDLGDLVLRSQPGLVVRVVSAATGLPLPGSTVELEPLLENPFLPDTHWALRRRASKSASDGRATVYGLREGRYRLWVTAAGYAGMGLIHSQPGAGARAPDRLVSLPPGFALRGQVLDPQGAPLAGALVRAEPVPHGEPWPPTRTDSNGSFLIPNLRRQDHRVTVESRTHGVLILEPVVVDDRDTTLVIHMPRGLSIRGTVLSDGLPVVGARVAARPREDWPLVVDGKVFRPGAVSDQQGGFSIGGLPEGRFLLRVQSKGFALAEPLEVEAGGPPIALSLTPACQVAGEVLDPGGGPVDGAQIEMLRSDDEGTEFSTLLNRVVHGREPLPRGETGPGGSFQLASVPPGSYRLRIRAVGHPPLVTESFQVPAGGSLSLPAAQFRRGAMISGRALLPDGTGAQGALVVAEPGPGTRPGTPGAEVTTAPDGAFSLGPLAAGSYQLFYYFPQGQTAAESAESRRLTTIQVQLESGAELVRNLIHR